MTINDYYKQELQALRILGAEFSETNPGLSTYLARKGQDPDVERLLEGFSFLTGRLRQYMDEELPEVSHTLAQLLWPNYLRPVPSYSILQYDAIREGKNAIDVPIGEEVMGIHPEHNEQCIFKTAYETEVLPLEMIDVKYYTDGDQSTIELKLQTSSEMTLDELDLKKLRFFIGDHEHVSDNLFLYLLNYVDDIELILKKDIPSKKISKESLKAVGFAENEQILPKLKNVFSGYVLLQEYFCYKDKYHFIDLENLNLLKGYSTALLESNDTFTIKINFSRKLEITKKISKDNFRLYCTPIVNLFEAEAEPIRKGMDEEYEVRPSGKRYQDSEVYSVSQTRGWDSRINKYHQYLPFESFEHTKENTEYYYTRIKLSEDALRTKTYIRFNAGKRKNQKVYEDDVSVSLDLMITNRDLPSTMDLGDISLGTQRSTVSKLTFKNITIPSESYIPPIRGDFLWRIVSNMSLNYLALDDIQILRSVLEAYDFIGANSPIQKKRTENLLNGLESISSKTSDMLFEGLPLRGIVTNIKLDGKRFSTMGEAYLLVTVLNAFLSLYCTVNSFHKLEVTVNKKEQFSWAPEMGKQSLL